MLVAAQIGKFALCGILAWIALNISIVVLKWLQSAMMRPSEAFSLDLRKDKTKLGKSLTIATVKANPFENIWFGHIWIDWHEAPEGGFKEPGFYAKCRISAALNLVGATISPLSFIHGQKPIESIVVDDTGLKRDWQLHLRVDEEIYQKALEIDKYWRNESRYVLRPALGGKTYSCRDYCLQIAEICGLKVSHEKWADFPPVTFREFLIENGIIKKRSFKLPRFNREKPVYIN